ncbi:MAG: helix-turn-helix domain-containing protein [Chloroflexi bacterium]|nr:helix-turn-helix domain-containing protein [Chloroflexota bacterium]
MNEKLYTTKEVASKLGKSVVTVRMLIRTHGIGQKIGTDYILTEKDIEALMKIPGPGRPKGTRKKA